MRRPASGRRPNAATRARRSCGQRLDAAWLPVVGAIDAVAGAAPLVRRPRRDIDGTLMRERRMPISRTHAFTSANEEEDDDD